MTLSKRDKLTALLGAAVAGGILLWVYVIGPCIQQWQDIGFQLGRKQARVAQLNERLEERDALLAERDRLSAIVGSVLGPEAYPPPKEKKEKKEPSEDKEPEAKEADAEEKDEQHSEPQAEADSQPPEPEGKGAEAKDSPEKKPEDKAIAEAKSAEKPKERSGEKDSPAAPPTTPPADSAKAGQPTDTKPTDKEQPPEKGADTPAPKGHPFDVYVERAAKKSGVNLKRLSRGKPVRSAKKVPQFAAVGLRLSFETQAGPLTQFLYALENGDRLLRIERSDIRRDLKKPDKITVSLNVVGYEPATGK